MEPEPSYVLDVTKPGMPAREVRPGEARPLPQHNRPDGPWCRWSGVSSVQPDGLCPDRCQAEAEAE